MPARAAKGAFLPGRGRGAIFCGAAFGRPARSARAGRAGKGQTVPEQHRAHKRHKACRRAAKAGPALAAVRVARAAFPSAGPFTASILAQAGPDIPDIPDKTGFLGHWRQNGLEKRPRALPVPANGSNKGRLHTVVFLCAACLLLQKQVSIRESVGQARPSWPLRRLPLHEPAVWYRNPAFLRWSQRTLAFRQGRYRKAIRLHALPMRQPNRHTARLSFVLPVSIWLIWVTEIPTKPASSSCESLRARLTLRIL